MGEKYSRLAAIMAATAVLFGASAALNLVTGDSLTDTAIGVVLLALTGAYIAIAGIYYNKHTSTKSDKAT